MTYLRQELNGANEEKEPFVEGKGFINLLHFVPLSTWTPPLHQVELMFKKPQFPPRRGAERLRLSTAGVAHCQLTDLTVMHVASMLMISVSRQPQILEEASEFYLLAAMLLRRNAYLRQKVHVTTCVQTESLPP